VRRILVETARSGRGSETLFDLFRISLASGGSIEDPGETITKEEIDPRIVIYMAATVQRDFTNNLSIKRTGIASDRLPQIDVVRNMATENLDAYTPGNVLGVTGEDLKIAKSDSAQGGYCSLGGYCSQSPPAGTCRPSRRSPHERLAYPWLGDDNCDWYHIV